MSIKPTLFVAALLTAAISAAGPAHATGDWWDTPSTGYAVCGLTKAAGRDYTVNYGIGSLNGTAEGARMVDTLIKKYCPQYAR